jgi:hypothetical protein
METPYRIEFRGVALPAVGKNGADPRKITLKL